MLGLSLSRPAECTGQARVASSPRKVIETRSPPPADLRPKYLELRFDERIRMVGLLVLVLNTLLRMGLWLLTPSLMLAKLTGISHHYSVFMTALITASYTSMGGMATIRKAELLQMFITVISLFSLLCKGKAASPSSIRLPTPLNRRFHAFTDRYTYPLQPSP